MSLRRKSELKKEGQNSSQRYFFPYQDFEVLGFLGAGAYGKVYLVRRRETKDVYALKVIRLPDK